MSTLLLLVSNIATVTNNVGHKKQPDGFWNIFYHIVSHVWILLFPIINMSSSIVKLSLTRFQPEYYQFILYNFIIILFLVA